MLSKQKQKYLRSLQQKKHRDAEESFIAEGEKAVEELLRLFSPTFYIYDPTKHICPKTIHNCEIIEASQSEIAQISTLTTPRPVIAVFKKPTYEIDYNEINSTLSIVLDDIQDPGNLGTIIRLAAWFGIENVICSLYCADLYSPKVVQSTMGAMCRVKIHYIDIELFFAKVKVPVFGAYLEGKNIYSMSLPQQGVIVMGNEGNGISAETEKFVTNKIFIPPYPTNSSTVESLNVATATAIVLSEFRRNLGV